MLFFIHFLQLRFLHFKTVINCCYNLTKLITATWSMYEYFDIFTMDEFRHYHSLPRTLHLVLVTSII